MADAFGPLAGAGDGGGIDVSNVRYVSVGSSDSPTDLSTNMPDWILVAPSVIPTLPESYLYSYWGMRSCSASGTVSFGWAALLMSGRTGTWSFQCGYRSSGNDVKLSMSATVTFSADYQLSYVASRGIMAFDAAYFA